MVTKHPYELDTTVAKAAKALRLPRQRVLQWIITYNLPRSEGRRGYHISMRAAKELHQQLEERRQADKLSKQLIDTNATADDPRVDNQWLTLDGITHVLRSTPDRVKQMASDGALITKTLGTRKVYKLEEMKDTPGICLYSLCNEQATTRPDPYELDLCEYHTRQARRVLQGCENSPNRKGTYGRA